MKEFIDKLIEKLEEYPTYSFGVSLLNTEEYIKVSDVKKIVNELAEEYKSWVMIDGQYCWQTCGATEHCKECRRLGNGDIDYYENWDGLYTEGE